MTSSSGAGSSPSLAALNAARTALVRAGDEGVISVFEDLRQPKRSGGGE